MFTVRSVASSLDHASIATAKGASLRASRISSTASTGMAKMVANSWKQFSLSIVEWLVSALLTINIISLLMIRSRHAGGLWRDECGCVQLALLPTWQDVQRQFQFEAFPLPFPAILRVISHLFGTSDEVYRAFGISVGLALIAAIWLTSWMLKRRPPLLSLALIGMSPTVLTWGTTVRGYGLASVSILLAFGTLLRVCQKPSWGWVITASLASLASVQFALHNCFLLAAIIGSAVIVLLGKREPVTALILSGIGLLCGLSILPYWAGYRSADWTVLIQVPVTLRSLISRFLAACGGDVPYLKAVWIGMLIGGLVTGIIGLAIHLRHRILTKMPLSESSCRLLVGLGVLFAAPAFYLAFLKALSYPTQSWYYVMLICILAAAVDLIIASVTQSGWWRVLQIMLVLGIMGWLTGPDLERMRVRQTNIDLVTQQLAEESREGDLIVVTPWYLGVSFQWYYHGPAEWTTVPAIEDLSVHRYDLFREKMLSPTPILDVKQRIEEALSGHHRVWLVGEILPVPEEGPHVLPLPPAPYTGWSDEAYRIAWTEQLNAWLASHVLTFTPIDIPCESPVMNAEYASVWRLQGWRASF